VRFIDLQAHARPLAGWKALLLLHRLVYELEQHLQDDHRVLLADVPERAVDDQDFSTPDHAV
jgi:hypothetical protein